jgi:hypothetical protein
MLLESLRAPSFRFHRPASLRQVDETVTVSAEAALKTPRQHAWQTDGVRINSVVDH